MNKLYFIQGMNDINSRDGIAYRKRWLAGSLRHAVTRHPVVIVTGARQTGKSTLLLNEEPFSQFRYITLDDFDILGQAEKDPAALLYGSRGIVIDEVQKSPGLLEAVKTAVDTRAYTHPVVLSGSANLALMKQVSESLAGRAVYFSLYPMTCWEKKREEINNPLNNLFNGIMPQEKQKDDDHSCSLEHMWRGCMPALLRYTDETSVLQWWEGYVLTYLERDLRQLSQIESLSDFRRLMQACALRTGSMINQTELSRDTGISQPTVHRYMNLLETTCLMHRVQAFAKNRTKRLIKAPKLMWADPGIAAFLGGFFSMSDLADSSSAGRIFESLVFLHLHVLCQLISPAARIYYWRTSYGKEVDFVIEWGTKLIGLEVKLTGKPMYGDLKGLKVFMDEYPETAACILIYTGKEIRIMDERIVAVPWDMLNSMY